MYVFICMYTLCMYVLEGIFVFLMGGLGVAAIVLFAEIMIYALTRSKQEKVSTCFICKCLSW